MFELGVITFLPAWRLEDQAADSGDESVARGRIGPQTVKAGPPW